MAGSARSSAMPPTGSIKNSDAIFSGDHYEEWRKRTTTAIAKDGAKLTIIPNNLERGYRAAEEFGQITQFPEYDKLQDIARGIITERIRDNDLRIIKHCKSAMHMLETLDDRYRITNDTGALAARTRLNRLVYDQKSDLRKFLNLFEARAEEAINAGNVLPDRDLMFQLTTSLGPDYISALDAMNNEPLEQRTFETFTKKVQEKYDLQKLFSKKPPDKPVKDSSDTRHDNRQSSAHHADQ